MAKTKSEKYLQEIREKLTPRGFNGMQIITGGSRREKQIDNDLREEPFSGIMFLPKSDGRGAFSSFVTPLGLRFWNSRGNFAVAYPVGVVIEGAIKDVELAEGDSAILYYASQKGKKI
jgi:hypothetical protein|tara:strand:- start:987 stop:1340 length:354 start_codon:yes stop_codon:yes gene_type:complete